MSSWKAGDWAKLACLEAATRSILENPAELGKLERELDFAKQIFELVAA
jgi:hypothetical protein